MTLDLTPFRAFSVGFDDLFDELRSFKTVGYPPYNIEKIKDGEYNISMAVAGFSKEDLSVKSEDGTLTIESKKSIAETKQEYVYKGIANRDFKKEFLLAENVFVKDVKLKDGMLEIFLERVIPENEKETVYQIN